MTHGEQPDAGISDRFDLIAKEAGNRIIQPKVSFRNGKSHRRGSKTFAEGIDVMR